MSVTAILGTHGSQTAALGNHVTTRWEYADLTARDAVTYTTIDIGGVARVGSAPYDFYVLTGVASWLQLGVDTAGELDHGNSGASPLIDWEASRNQRITLNNNVSPTFKDPTGPGNLQLVIIQDGTGDRTFSWPTPSIVRAPGGVVPTIGGTAGSHTVVSLYYNGAGEYYVLGSAVNMAFL